MLPSENRLLSGIRDALRSAIALDPGSKIAAAIAAASVGIDELLLRTDQGFFAAYYAQGFALAREGAELVPSRVRAAVGGATETVLPQALEAPLHGDQMRSRFDALRSALTNIVADLTPHEDSNRCIKVFLSRVVDWENALHALRLQRAVARPPADEAPGSQFTEQAVEEYLRARFPDWRELKVDGLRKLAGGFSKTTVLFDVEDALNGRQSLVIRAEQPMTLVFLDGAAVENEYALLKLAHRAGLRVAVPMWLERDTNHFGSRFLVSRKAPGRNIGTAVSVNEEVSDPLLSDLVANLSRIHHTRVVSSDDNVQHSHLKRWSEFRTLTESTRENVADWRRNSELIRLPASPMVARALDWLTNNIPECDERPSLIHRDYGLHNILVQDDRVSCILDWECATLGDPAEDLAWTTSNMGERVDPQRVLDLYAQASGRAIPENRLRFFEVFNSLKYAVICSHALSLFENHPTAPISACQLGLLHTYHGTKPLNHHIEMAESCR